MSTDHEVFWLARYAHNTLAPLIEEAKAVDPSIRFSIEMRFPNPGTHHGNGSVAVYAHWDREDTMFLYATSKRTKADIDQVAEQVRDKVIALKNKAAIAALEPAFTF